MLETVRRKATRLILAGLLALMVLGQIAAPAAECAVSGATGC